MSENPIIMTIRIFFSFTEQQMFAMVLLPILFLIILPRIILSGVLFRLMSKGFDVLDVPIDLTIRILREHALQRVLNWILSKIEEYVLQKVFSITYTQLLLLSTSLLFLAITPGHILPAEVITLLSFMLLVIEKVYVIKLAKTAMQRAKKLEGLAVKLDKRGEFGFALEEYSKALDVYRQSLLLKNPILDGERVKLLEHMAILLYKMDSFDKALIRYNQALDLYKRPHILNYTTVDDRARVLQNSANLLYELGRRREAQKRYDLIYELTGRRRSYWSF
jgi:tetratricopeptide (TPR) repeat protein